MRLNLDTGRVQQARYIASPNCDARPPAVEIGVIVIHCISLPPKQFGGCEVEAFFCNSLNPSQHEYFRRIQNFRVSAHFFIRRNGELIQFVPTHQRAWHAGESRFQGRSHVNDFSIGIELEGADDCPYDEPQYEVLSELSRVLMAAHPAINTANLVGHCDIAPNRKTDPGAHFDWPRYRGSLG